MPCVFLKKIFSIFSALIHRKRLDYYRTTVLPYYRTTVLLLLLTSLILQITAPHVTLDLLSQVINNNKANDASWFILRWIELKKTNYFIFRRHIFLQISTFLEIYFIFRQFRWSVINASWRLLHQLLPPIHIFFISPTGLGKEWYTKYFGQSLRENGTCKVMHQTVNTAQLMLQFIIHTVRWERLGLGLVLG